MLCSSRKLSGFMRGSVFPVVLMEGESQYRRSRHIFVRRLAVLCIQETSAFSFGA